MGPSAAASLGLNRTNGLARALSACGDRGSAATLYQDLLALWQDADPYTPVVQHAVAERAKAK